MTLQPQLLGSPPPSLPRIVAATVLVTTAVFTAGLVTGAALMRLTPTQAAPAVRPVVVEAPPRGLFAEPPPAVAISAVPAVAAVPALPHLGWTATVSRGEIDPGLLWASKVADFSSQYTDTSWSAEQAVGAPDVYPRTGDDAAAWASLSADGGREALDVGFDEDGRLSAVHVFETFNPGAIRRIEASASDGRTVVLYDRGPARGPRGAADASAAIQVISGGCTPFAIARLRISLDSHTTPGWNEIDAVGVRFCD